MTAFVIPNAIQITSRAAKYLFASLARDTAYDVIYNIRCLARPEHGRSEDETLRSSAQDVSHMPGGCLAKRVGCAVARIRGPTDAQGDVLRMWKGEQALF